MADYFTQFGNGMRATLSHFAEGVAGGIISEIQPIVYTGILLYFIFRAYNVMAGRSPGESLVDVVTTCVKVTLVAFFGLNSAQFVAYVIPAVQGFENMLLSAVGHGISGGGDTTSAWNALDRIWESFSKTFMRIYDIYSDLGFTDYGSIFALIVLMLIMAIVCIFFTFACVGIILLYEIFLILALGFGPLFLCTLMFPVTRTWFDGWLRTTVTFAFTLVIVSAVIFLITDVFNQSVDDVLQVVKEAKDDDKFAKLVLPVLNFGVIGLAVATVVKLIPSLVAGMTGGVSLQAVGLGAMMTGVGGGTRNMLRTGAGTYGAGLYGAGQVIGNEAWTDKGRQLMGSEGLTSTGNLSSAALGAVTGGTGLLLYKTAGLLRPSHSEDGSSAPISAAEKEQAATAAANAESVGASAAAQTIRTQAGIAPQSQQQTNSSTETVSGAHFSEATQSPVTSGTTASSSESNPATRTEFGSSPEDFGTVGTFDKGIRSSEAEHRDDSSQENMRAINALNSRANNQEKTQVEEKEK